MSAMSRIGEVTRTQDGDLSIDAREMTGRDCLAVVGIVLLIFHVK